MSADITAGAGAGSSPDYARKALIGSTLGFAMDGFDLLILGFMLPAIATDLGLSPVQSGALVTWTLIGAVLGGILFGVLSDYYAASACWPGPSCCCRLHRPLCPRQGFWDLLAYRFVAGLGLAASSASAWRSRPKPGRRRSARASSYVALGWQGGVLLAALVTPLLLPLIGWRACSQWASRRPWSPSSCAVRSGAGDLRRPRQGAAPALPLGLLVKDWETTKTSLPCSSSARSRTLAITAS